MEKNKLLLIFIFIQSDVEESIARIKTHKGVKGLLIVTFKGVQESSGVPIFVKSTFAASEEQLANNYGVKLS